MKKFDLVKKCIDTALLESRKKANFVPFQVKTVQGRYYVEKCYDELLKGKCTEYDAIDAIVKATDAILQYFDHPENNLYYVFKVVRFYAQIFRFIKDAVTNREISIYIEKSSIMNKHMLEYIKNSNESQYLEKVKTWQKELDESIEEAKKLMS
jgi:hypothetical protein